MEMIKLVIDETLLLEMDVRMEMVEKWLLIGFVSYPRQLGSGIMDVRDCYQILGYLCSMIGLLVVQWMVILV